MKVIDLLEGGTLKHGYYQLGQWPRRADRADERIYNFVIPELAKIIGVPARYIKKHSYKDELIIKIISTKVEEDMVKLIAPKALKSLLEKAGFENVTTDYEDVGELHNKPSPSGRYYPLLRIDYKFNYPQKWLDWDKQRYNINWS